MNKSACYREIQYVTFQVGLFASDTACDLFRMGAGASGGDIAMPIAVERFSGDFSFWKSVAVKPADHA